MINYQEGDTIKIRGKKYFVHIGNDDEMRLEAEDEE